MHHYNIILMFYNDKQKDVDAFIVAQEPGATQTPRPDKPAILETLYTRLRNELGHRRQGINIDRTKADMANHLNGIIALSKKAIELNP